MCKYSRHNNGADPPRFNEDYVYALAPSSSRDYEVQRTGAELNIIQEDVIYDMTKRWRAVAPIIH
jgi:hypothetical protein